MGDDTKNTAAGQGDTDSSAKGAADKQADTSKTADTTQKADTTKAADGKAAADDSKKTTDATGSDTANKDGAAAQKPKVPDKYELKAPEGGYVDDDDLVRVAALAKAEGWTNEEAQAQLDRHAKSVAAQADAWLAETKADPQYGGEKLAEAQKRARAVIDRVRPDGHPRRDAFLRILDKTGYGNHIEVLSFFADLGKLAAEDTPAGGGTSPREPKSWYDHPTSRAVAAGKE